MRRIGLATLRLRYFFKNSEGGALAELALTVPFLALMLAGVAEFGRFFQTYTTLVKATRVSARYLSNHPFNDAERAKARNLVVCGQLDCTGQTPVAPGLTTAMVCIQSTGVANPITVTVSIPRDDAGGCGAHYPYQPIFDLGALLHDPNYATNLWRVNPSTTMYYMLDN